MYGLGVYPRILGSQRVPVDWKLANIPLPKQSKEEDLGNHRPVVSLWDLAKLWRRSFRESLRNCKENTLIGNSQHGFTRGNSVHKEVHKLNLL